MSRINVSIYFNASSLAEAVKAFTALHELNIDVQSVGAESSTGYQHTAVQSIFGGATEPQPSTSDVAAQTPAGNGQTPRGSREINDVLAAATDGLAGETRHFNVYKNKPSESEYRDADHAASYASDTRQALLSITQYEDGQVSMVLRDVRSDRGAVVDEQAPVKSVRFFNVYGDRPSSKAWESRAQADEKASDTRKAVLVITRYEDDTVGMQLVDTRG